MDRPTAKDQEKARLEDNFTMKENSGEGIQKYIEETRNSLEGLVKDMLLPESQSILFGDGSAAALFDNPLGETMRLSAAEQAQAEARREEAHAQLMAGVTPETVRAALQSVASASSSSSSILSGGQGGNLLEEEAEAERAITAVAEAVPAGAIAPLETHVLLHPASMAAAVTDLLSKEDWEGAKALITDCSRHHQLTHIPDGPSDAANGGTPLAIFHEMLLMYYHEVMSIHNNAKNTSVTVKLFSELIGSGVNPSTETWAYLVEAQANPKGDYFKILENGTDTAIATIDRLRDIGVPLNTGMFNSVLSSYIVKKENDEVFDWWMKFHEEPDLSLDNQSFHLMLKFYEFTREAERALWLLDEMKSMKLIPTIETFNQVIRTCAYAPMWADGFEDIIDDVLKMVEGAEIAPNVETYNCLIHAFGQAGDSRAAEFYFWEMKTKKIEPTTRTYNMLLRAYSKSQGVGDTTFGRKGRYARPPNKHWQREPTQHEQDFMDVGAQTATKLMAQGIHYADDGDDKRNARGGKHNRGGLQDPMEDLLIQEDYKDELRQEAREAISKYGTVQQQLAADEEGADGYDSTRLTGVSTSSLQSLPTPTHQQQEQHSSRQSRNDSDLGLDTDAKLAAIFNSSGSEGDSEMAALDQMGEMAGEDMDLSKWIDAKGLGDKDKEELLALLSSADDMGDEELDAMIREIEAESEQIIDDLKSGKEVEEDEREGVGFESAWGDENDNDEGNADADADAAAAAAPTTTWQNPFYAQTWTDPYYTQRKSYIRAQKLQEEAEAESSGSGEGKKGGSIFKFINERKAAEAASADDNKGENTKLLASNAKVNENNLVNDLGLGDALALLDGGDSSSSGNGNMSPYVGPDNDYSDFHEYVDEQWDKIEFGTAPPANYLYEENLRTRRTENRLRAKMAFDAMTDWMRDTVEPITLVHEEEGAYHSHDVAVARQSVKATSNADAGTRLKPDEQTLTTLLGVYAENKRDIDAYRILDSFPRFGVVPSVLTYTHLIKMHIRRKEFDSAMKIKKDIAVGGAGAGVPMHPDAESFGYLVNWCTTKDDLPQALQLLEEATELGLKLQERHLRVLRGRCANLGVVHPDLGEDPHKWVKDIKKMRNHKHSTQRRVEMARSSSYSRE